MFPYLYYLEFGTLSKELVILPFGFIYLLFIIYFYLLHLCKLFAVVLKTSKRIKMFLQSKTSCNFLGHTMCTAFFKWYI